MDEGRIRKIIHIDMDAFYASAPRLRWRRGLPGENDVRNAIDRVTVSATDRDCSKRLDRRRGADRVLTLPWTRAPSRLRREIIQGVGEAQGPQRAMRTKARESFVRALRDAHRWLDELLIDPAQTIESLAMREHKSERSIRMTVSLAFVSPSWRKPPWRVTSRAGSASSA